MGIHLYMMKEISANGRTGFNTLKEVMEMNIVKGKYISVWDGNTIKIATNCMVDMETKEVFDIETINPDDYYEELDVLDEEYVIINNKRFEVEEVNGVYYII